MRFVLNHNQFAQNAILRQPQQLNVSQNIQSQQYISRWAAASETYALQIDEDEDASIECIQPLSYSFLIV